MRQYRRSTDTNRICYWLTIDQMSRYRRLWVVSNVYKFFQLHYHVYALTDWLSRCTFTISESQSHMIANFPGNTRDSFFLFFFCCTIRPFSDITKRTSWQAAWHRWQQSSPVAVKADYCAEKPATRRFRLSYAYSTLRGPKSVEVNPFLLSADWSCCPDLLRKRCCYGANSVIVFACIRRATTSGCTVDRCHSKAMWSSLIEAMSSIQLQIMLTPDAL